MSSPYAGNPALYPSSITLPSDGDARNAASVNVAFEALADRTAYLSTSGTRVLRTAATTAAMSALTGMANGEICLVGGTGLYYFASGSAATIDAWLVFTAVGGRWIHESASFANTSPGFAAIGVAGASANRIPASVVPNRIVSLDVNAPATIPFSAGGSTLVSQSVALTAGDKVVFSHTGQLSCSAGAVAGRVEYGYNDGSYHVLRTSRYVQSGDPEVECSASFSYTAAGSLTVYFLVRTDVTGGGGTFGYIVDSLTALAVRS